jgi:hypothetical protein
MSILNREPKRNADINSLTPPMRSKTATLLALMHGLGYDAILFEARRAQVRQKWLYGWSRTHHKFTITGKRTTPKTWTLHSEHFNGEAGDIVSRRKLWAWPEFYDALEVQARKVGLYTISRERCHIQLRKP